MAKIHYQFKLMLYTQFVLFAMDADQESAAAAVVIGVLLKRRKSKQRKKRSVWVKPWLQRRNKLGVYHTLLQELRMEAGEEYKQFLRMSPELFDELLILVEVTSQRHVSSLQVLIKKSFSSAFLFFPAMLFILTSLIFDRVIVWYL